MKQRKNYSTYELRTNGQESEWANVGWETERTSDWVSETEKSCQPVSQWIKVSVLWVNNRVCIRVREWGLSWLSFAYGGSRGFLTTMWYDQIFPFRFITILYYLNNVEEGGETAFLIADNTTTTPDVSNSTIRILKYAAYTLWIAYSTRISTTDHDHRQRNSSRKKKKMKREKTVVSNLTIFFLMNKAT